jgi:hypothetical protein
MSGEPLNSGCPRVRIRPDRPPGGVRLTEFAQESKTHQRTPKQHSHEPVGNAPQSVKTPRMVPVLGLVHPAQAGGDGSPLVELAQLAERKAEAEGKAVAAKQADEDPEAEKRRERARKTAEFKAQLAERKAEGKAVAAKQADEEAVSGIAPESLTYTDSSASLSASTAKGRTEQQREQRGEEPPSYSSLSSVTYSSSSGRAGEYKRGEQEIVGAPTGARAPEGVPGRGLGSSPTGGALTEKQKLALERDKRAREEEQRNKDRQAKRAATHEAAARELKEAREREKDELKAAEDRRKAEEQAEQERRKQEQEERRKSNGPLIEKFKAEGAQGAPLVKNAEALVGRLTSIRWETAADPWRAQVFALALKQVQSKDQSLIKTVPNVVKKHRTSEQQLEQAWDWKENVFVLELVPPQSAAEGMATSTVVNFPIDTTYVDAAEAAAWALAGERPLTEADVQPLRDAVSAAADKLAPTVIHEFTHLALHKSHRNKSNPSLPSSSDDRKINPDKLDYGQKLKTLTSTLSPDSPEAKRLPQLLSMTNPDWAKPGGLKAEIDELTDFAEDAPSDVKPICELMTKYSEWNKASELPSHLMEIVYLKGEDWLRRKLPKGHAVLVRLQQQWATHLESKNLDKDWFAAHELPPGNFNDL